MAKNTGIGQPIIRGIQAVGSVDLLYRYNGNGGKLLLPNSIRINDDEGNRAVLDGIDTREGIKVAGFRLDSEFLRANPQIASSVVIPILGGGGVALTNNNRTGTLNVACTKVSTPDYNPDAPASMYTPAGSGIGAISEQDGQKVIVYDLVTLAQIQQAQLGGDDAGATLDIAFNFCDQTTIVEFQGCTIGTIDPLALTGNDAAGYNVAINFLNWVVEYNAGSSHTTAANGVAINNG